MGRRRARTNLDTIDNEEVLLLVHVALVTRIHPSVLERLRRRLRVVQVPECHAGAADDELSLLPDPAPRPVRLQNAARSARNEPPRRAGGADAHVELREGEGGAGLGHAVALTDAAVGEDARDLVRELGAERGGAAREHLDVAEVVILHCGVLGRA